MAIGTFGELKTAIANFLARSDLTDRIPEFISLAEARMGRELSTRSQEKRSTATVSGGDAFVSLPTDLRSVRLVKLNSSPTEVLEYYTLRRDVLFWRNWQASCLHSCGRRD